MKIKIDTACYNERRYGKPWIAKVKFVEGKAEFDFGNWVGSTGGGGILELDVAPGDVIARGQKDFRKPAASAPDYYIVTPEFKTEIKEIHPRAMFEAGFNPVSKKEAYEHFSSRTVDAVALRSEKDSLLARIAEIDKLLSE